MKKQAKNSVKVGLIRGNSVSKTTKPDIQLYKQQVAAGKKPEVAIRKALIGSRLDHPIVLKYGEGHLRLSPRGQLTIGDFDKLQKNLPKGVHVSKMYEEKKEKTKK